MTPEQFAYWLQGYAELSVVPPSQEQWDSIREHLAAVFHKVTPKMVHPANMNGPMPVIGPHKIPSAVPGGNKEWDEMIEKAQKDAYDRAKVPQQASPFFLSVSSLDKITC